MTTIRSQAHQHTTTVSDSEYKTRAHEEPRITIVRLMSMCLPQCFLYVSYVSCIGVISL